MRADFHQGDERFAITSRNKQNVAMSVVGLSYFLLNKNPATWKTADLNGILMSGNSMCEAAYTKKESSQSDPLALTDVLMRINIGDKIFDLGLSENLLTNKLSWNNLVAGLKQFFEEENNVSGVFTYETFSFAIMREADSFFLLNSQATAYDGEPLDPLNNESAACLMQMFSINCLAERLLEACYQSEMLNDPTSENGQVFSINIIIFLEQLGRTPATRLNRKRKLLSNESKRKSDRLNERSAKPNSEQREV